MLSKLLSNPYIKGFLIGFSSFIIVESTLCYIRNGMNKKRMIPEYKVNSTPSEYSIPPPPLYK